MNATALDYPYVAGRLFDQPLLIEQRKLNTILRVLSPRMGFSVSAELSESDDAPPPPLPPAMHAAAMRGIRAERQREGHFVAGSAAVIPIVGSLVQRGGYVGYSGMTSYDAIERMFDSAMANSDISQILLEVDSPGGEVSGAFDLAEKIYQARGTKRIVASVSELAASAGYLLASSASEVSVPRTGYTGSVGVVTAHVDFSDALKQEGIAVTFLFAGEKKVDANPYEPLSDRARKDISADIQSLYDLFVETVARNRGIKASAVRGTEAGMYLGRAGVDIGFADRINTFTNEFSNAALKTSAGSRRLSTPSHTEITMSETTTAADATQTAAPDAALAQARAEGHAEGVKAGAAAERTRIESILTHADAEGREATAQHLAFKTDMAADAAVALMASTPKASGAAGLDAAMHAHGVTGVRPSGTDDDGDHANVVQLNTAEIYAKRAKRFGQTAE
jgi:signal peptide peptidase SppA